MSKLTSDKVKDELYREVKDLIPMDLEISIEV